MRIFPTRRYKVKQTKEGWVVWYWERKKEIIIPIYYIDFETAIGVADYLNGKNKCGHTMVESIRL